MERLHLNRATVAGVGTTAALVAAVLAVSLVVGGLVAYTASPRGPLVSGQPSLALPGSGGALAAVTDGGRRPLVVPRIAATPAPATTRPAARTSGAGTGGTQAATKVASPVKPRPRKVPAFTSTTSTGPADPGPAPATGTVTEPARKVTSSLSDTTSSLGNGLGTAVQQTTGGLDKATAPLLPSLSPVLHAVGQGAANLITSTTDALAEVIRRLGGGR